MKIKFLLLSVGMVIFFSENSKATDVCASKPLYNQNDANKLCPDACKKEGFSWTGVWLGKTSKDCRDYDPENIFGSICQCELKCTDVYISYTYNPDNPANWTASVWYTPCGATKEAALPFYARDWNNNHLSIQQGTRLRIGPQGTAVNYIDTVVLDARYDVLCAGTLAQGEERAHCEHVEPTPVKKCTEVTIDYAPDTHLTADIYYTPCGARPGADQEHNVAYNKLSVMVQSGTNVRIGSIIQNLFNAYINEPLSGPKVNVLCSGTLGKNGNCKIVP